MVKVDDFIGCHKKLVQYVHYSHETKQTFATFIDTVTNGLILNLFRSIFSNETIFPLYGTHIQGHHYTRPQKYDAPPEGAHVQQIVT